MRKWHIILVHKLWIPSGTIFFLDFKDKTSQDRSCGFLRYQQHKYQQKNYLIMVKQFTIWKSKFCVIIHHIRCFIVKRIMSGMKNWIETIVSLTLGNNKHNHCHVNVKSINCVVMASQHISGNENQHLCIMS